MLEIIVGLQITMFIILVILLCIFSNAATQMDKEIPLEVQIKIKQLEFYKEECDKRIEQFIESNTQHYSEVGKYREKIKQEIED